MTSREQQAIAFDVLSRMPLLSRAWGTYLVVHSWMRQAQLLRTYGRWRQLSFRGVTLEFDFSSSHDAQVYDAIRKQGAYEPETTAAIVDYLKPGDVFIDIGANNGYYSILAAKAVGSGGRVIAVEPNESPFKRLLRNVELNGFGSVIQAICAAAGRSSGVTTLFLSPRDDGWTSTRRRTPFPVRVQTIAIDEVVTPPLRLTVKMDIEGDELTALSGMQSLIGCSQRLALIIEWNRKYASPALRRVLFDNFVVYRILLTATGVELRLISEAEVERGISLCNLWCEKESSSVTKV